jgi:hypothetical protein
MKMNELVTLRLYWRYLTVVVEVDTFRNFGRIVLVHNTFICNTLVSLLLLYASHPVNQVRVSKQVDFAPRRAISR